VRRFLETKIRILSLLKAQNLEEAIAEILRYPARQVVNPLFSLLYSMDERIKWHAVSAMGEVTANLAARDMESARVVMRRLIWNLNDESGGIGWGSAEAMGETMALHQGLAQEYGSILLSYIMEDGNFLDHEELQRGALWGLGRLSHARPSLLKGAALYLLPFFDYGHATTRGLAAWASCHLGEKILKPPLVRLIDDHRPIKLFRDRRLVQETVANLAKSALAAIDANRHSS